jgi:hypothetical protein
MLTENHTTVDGAKPPSGIQQGIGIEADAVLACQFDTSFARSDLRCQGFDKPFRPIGPVKIASIASALVDSARARAVMCHDMRGHPALVQAPAWLERCINKGS